MKGFGLRLVRSQGMEGYTGNLNTFPIDPGNTNPIFTGDPVAMAATGFTEEATGAADSDDFDIWGIFMGCQYVDSDGSIEFRQHWDGGAGRENIMAHIAQPPHGIFHIRGKAGTTYTQAGTIGKRFGVSYVAGSTKTGDSAITLGAATAATGPLIVHRLADLPNNDWSADMPVFEVSIARPAGYLAVAS